MSQLSRRELARVIIGLFDKGLSIKKVADEIAAYLLAENRTSELAPLMRDVLDEKAKNGIIEATATSAFELNNEVKKELERLVASNYKESKKVILKDERDSALIGGVKLTAGEMQLDLTVHGRLKYLTQLQPERNIT